MIKPLTRLIIVSTIFTAIYFLFSIFNTKQRIIQDKPAPSAKKIEIEHWDKTRVFPLKTNYKFNGTIVIQNTWNTIEKKPTIYIDADLPSCGSCIFRKTNNWKNTIDGDAVITRNPGFVANAPLQFTKILLGNADFTGSDIYASPAKQSRMKKYEIYPSPMHMPLYDIQDDLMKPVKEKQDVILMVFNPIKCYEEYKTSFKILSKKTSSKIIVYPSQCVPTSIPECNSNDLDCYFSIAKSSIIVDFEKDDWLVPVFYKSIANGCQTGYHYHSQLKAPYQTNFYLDKFKRYPQSKDIYIRNMYFTNEIYDYLNNYKSRNFLWKEHGSEVIDELNSHSMEKFTCRVCDYVKQKKKSTKCLIERFKNTNLELQKPNLDVGNIYVNHYSKAVERVDHMQQQLKKLNSRATFISQFDKEELDEEFIKCINTDSIRKISEYNYGLKPGEISLAVKSFFVYYNILLNDLSSGLVLEDDIDVQHNLIDQVVQMVPSNYAFIQIGQCGDSYLKTVYKDDIQTEKFKLFPNFGDFRHCTTAYIISKLGSLLMFKTLPIIYAIDYQICYGPMKSNYDGAVENPDFSVYSVWPALIKPAETLSGSGIRD
ncbi:hypothetical protein HK103_005757 [Boothiomyces macroporosus]|uniref:Glycosyl transferase family 25 domain-containing protein n=1 Tax=Boothiomyces macroporosus TaxID=261099 RepID=A0AAD5UHV5_9FUNG|nr:hypothetical protein HK103_005757 [Boothiomyces macroporosus]